MNYKVYNLWVDIADIVWERFEYGYNRSQAWMPSNKKRYLLAGIYKVLEG